MNLKPHKSTRSKKSRNILRLNIHDPSPPNNTGRKHQIMFIVCFLSQGKPLEALAKKNHVSFQPQAPNIINNLSSWTPNKTEF